jgi:hypothetical protein
MTCDHEAQIRDLLEEREELLTEIRRLRMGRHPAGRALRPVVTGPHSDPYCVGHCSVGIKHSQCGCLCNHREPSNFLALAEALTERDAEHEGGGGA